MKIVVIDSGVDLSHRALKKKTISGCSISYEEGVVAVSNDFGDTIGHGTAVNFILQQAIPGVEIFNIKIYDDETCQPEALCYALDYINNELDCDIVNISLGVTCYENIPAIRKRCENLTLKGVVIVSAFDNNGVLSYPAAFNNVLGVDINRSVHKLKDFIFVENNCVNLIGSANEQRLPWLNNTYEFVSGASFIAPYCTALVASIMESGIHDFYGILQALKEKAIKTISCAPFIPYRKLDFAIGRAVAFPFNKEMHTVARFKTFLCGEVQAFYDVKYTGNISRSLSSLLGTIEGEDMCIQDYRAIDWQSDFDTLILGHTSQLSDLLGIDFEEYFLLRCIKYHKNVFSFAEIRNKMFVQQFMQNNLQIYYPSITETCIPNNTIWKLRKIGKPVVGVFGTGPRQGKFTLQLKLRYLFENSGYSVGMLSSEPTAALFRISQVYPMGYESSVHIQGGNAVQLINFMMGELEDENPDIIFVGSQSQTVPATDGALKYYPISQYEFLLGTAPDCYILCVNVFDENSYIERTIAFLESVFESKVLALALFPFDQVNKWSILGTKKVMAPQQVIDDKIENLKLQFGIPVYCLTDDQNIIEIGEKCVEYFSEK